MRIAAAVTAIASGLLVLFGYFIPVTELLKIRVILVQWAVILGAVAIWVGVLNLLGVHFHKIHTRQKGGAYSILLIVSLFASLVLGSVVGTDSPPLLFFLEAIIIPAESTLMALLAVTLLYASARLLRHRVDVFSFIFLGVAVVVLLAAAPLPFGRIPLLGYVVSMLTQYFAAAGARGILIGVALGALTTGLRVLFGVDRPYGGN